MDINKALEIAEDFRKHLENNNEGLIKKYSKSDMHSALSKISQRDKDKQWYKAMEKYVEKLEAKEMRPQRIFEKVIMGIVIGVCVGFISGRLGFNKRSNNIQIDHIIYNNNVYSISAKDIVSGITVTAATSNLTKAPEWIRYAIEDYLKSHNITEEGLKK